MNVSGLFNSLASNLPQIIIAFLVFGLLIFFHELGHFLTAKWAKIKVNEFAMGMGPTIWNRKKGETVYALRLFPIGGFCALEGDDEESGDERAFGKAPLYKRMIVIMAGSVMNLLLGLLILGLLSSRQTLGTTTIAEFGEGAVTNQWLQVGDSIRRINNHRVRTDNDMIYEFSRDRDGVMDIEVSRPKPDGTAENVLLKSVAFKMETLPEGVQMITLDFKVKGVRPTFWSATTNAFNWTGSLIRQVWGGFADLITGRYGFNALSGPVGVTTAIGQAARFGWKSLFVLVAFITVNLGVFNLLPLPALDGGRMMFLLIESVRRKPVNPRYEGLVHGIGMLLLIGLMILVTVNDVAKML